MLKTVSISILVLLAAFTAAPAGERKPQQEIFPEISTATLKKRMDSAANFFLVDARTGEEFAQGHLPGAVNIPPESVKHIAGFLPKDKDIPVVFYCRGHGWTLSFGAAVAAKYSGYRNLLIYQAGYPAWVEADLPVEKD